MDRLRVLVADDELGMRKGIERALSGFRFSLPDVNGEVTFAVETAESGERAMEMIRAQAPDVLLLDHKLPGMSGLEVLDQVVDGEYNLVTVMITAYASLDTAVSAIKRGAYDFLAKPFTPEELRNTVRKASQSLILARQARRLAAEKRQLRFQFISVLAHELKAPLAAIEGYLHIIRDHSAGDDPGVYDHMLDRCLIRSEYMRKMIADLLDLTRIESGRRARQLAEVDLAEIAHAAIETAIPQARERGITIDLHADGPVRFVADRAEMEIIFNNLISNAVKYNRDGGRADVTLAPQDGLVEIRVSDTGIGLTAEEASKLFSDFVRIKNERTRNVLGSGLGLSIVKKLAVIYGGDATVESTPGVGSTFSVTLTEAPAQPENVREEPAGAVGRWSAGELADGGDRTDRTDRTDRGDRGGQGR